MGEILDNRINFGRVQISTGYDAVQTSITLDTGEGSKLPDPAVKNYNLTWWNNTDYSDPSKDPNVEIVRVTAKVGDVLTVTRAQEGTSGSTKNVASKIYGMILSLTKKTVDDIDDKLTEHERALKNYDVDTGAANAYVITISPAPASYVEGDEYKFKASNANTGASTLNVNGLGAKDLKRKNGDALDPGDIVAGQILTVIYSGSVFLIQSEIVSKKQITKAWISFDGTGTITIKDSFNITSIIDNGTGNYTVNFADDFANTNYCPVVSCGNANRNASTVVKLVGSIDIITRNITGSSPNNDSVDINLIVMGVLA